MTETLIRPDIPVVITSQPEAWHSPMQLEREELVADLLDKGLISKDLVDSGDLDDFEIDESLHVDALNHILLGDETGGGHHLPTVMRLGRDNLIVASPIHDPLRPDKTIRDFRRAQTARAGRAFKALGVMFKDANGKVFRKDGGSTFFPSEWSTEEVVRSVLRASRMPGRHNPAKGLSRHALDINGVNVIATTHDLTGKIIGGFPGLGAS